MSRDFSSRELQGSRFRIAVVVFAAGAFAFTVGELVHLEEPSAEPWFVLPFAVWCTSPVLGWMAWGLIVADAGRPFRIAVTVIGVFLLPAVVGYQLLIASTDSSTAGLGYVTFPLGLLFGTAVAGGIAGGLAARAVDRTRATDPDSALLSEFSDRVDDLRDR